MRRGRGAGLGGAIAAFALAALSTNCGGGSGGAGGTTGTAGIGGSTGGRAGTTGRGGSGTAGSSGTGGATTGGTTGSAGSGGTTGGGGSGGTTGAAGTGGASGGTGTGGTSGAGGTGGAGRGGTTGGGGTGGSTGGASTGGATGAGGTGGTTGGAGSGGTTGGAGNGGTTGAAGSGGTTGGAGSGGTTGGAGNGGTTGAGGMGGTTGAAGSGGTTGGAGSGGTTGAAGGGGTGTAGTGGSGGGTASCEIPSGSGTITQQYGDAHVMCPKDYIVQNNAWGSTAGQTITFGPGTKFKVTVQNETRTNNTTPAGYPSIFTGAYNGRSTTGSGLPRAISAIAASSLPTSFTWASNGATGSYNAAYDVWFSTGAGGDPAASAPSGGFLMIWFNDSPENQPFGAAIANGTVTIGGKPFSIWYGMNGSRPCVSYVAQQDVFTWSFSLGDFIQDAIARNCSGTTKCVNPSWYLTNVFAGFEIWYGGVGLEVKDFGLTVP